ncbi:MAG TPA: hypothetical protein P5572_12930 [Phycisphaerae bacterium]|nr:hypothetical protein [Phycisphaerae bacterium]
MQQRTSIVLANVLGFAAAAGLAGCGTMDALPGVDTTARLSDKSACTDAPAPQDAGTLFVLVWDGGFSTQTGDAELAPFDVSTLRFSDGTALTADLPSHFEHDVLARIQTILCDLQPADITVVADKAEAWPDATIVHITGDAPFSGGKHIGQSDFDPCNAHPDDAAVIWGGALATRMPPLAYDQWVNVIANTTAHEIGHTLGFTHPSEESVARMLPQPSEEIMRANVKPAELAGLQYFLLQQETCPGEAPGAGSYASLAVDATPLGG